MTKINKILIVNDDGIDAIGLKSIVKIANEICDDVWIAAPMYEQSGVSRAISIHDPIYVTKRDEKTFAIKGTPADCVIMALEKLLDSDPDLILSGVNRGHNAADFMHLSGTVAGAGMGSSYGIPSMALSLMGNIRSNHKTLHWQMVEQTSPALIQKLFDMQLDPNNIININYPDCSADDVKGIKTCKQGKRSDRFAIVDERENLRGSNYYWINFKGMDANPQPDSELEALKQNYIAVTAISQDLTNYKMNEFINKNL
ncbi:MAG: 5'/3'-nucleotidase SurE [Alphaproteobacteria bacterium]|nr:5'/3'-nucleotidase SurE [Alphaproteobacteria bacterium]